MMAPSNSTYKYGFKVAAATFTVAFFFFLLTVLPPKSDESQLSESSKMMMIGSKPPACVNKCMKCRPCMATLIIPNHKMKGLKATLSLSHREEDSYYLLSWKCRCGDRLFQP